MNLFDLEAHYSSISADPKHDGRLIARLNVESLGGVPIMKTPLLDAREQLWPFQQEYLDLVSATKYRAASERLQNEVNKNLRDDRIVVVDLEIDESHLGDLEGNFSPNIELPFGKLSGKIAVVKNRIQSPIILYNGSSVDLDQLGEDHVFLHELGHAYDYFFSLNPSIIDILVLLNPLKKCMGFRQVFAETEARQNYVSSLFCNALGLSSTAEFFMEISDTYTAMLNGSYVEK